MIKVFLIHWLGKLKCKLEESKPSDVITFDGNLAGDDMPHVNCTCGWHYGPNRLVILVLEAKEHSRGTGHSIKDFTDHIL